MQSMTRRRPPPRRALCRAQHAGSAYLLSYFPPPISPLVTVPPTIPPLGAGRYPRLAFLPNAAGLGVRLTGPMPRASDLCRARFLAAAAAKAMADASGIAADLLPCGHRKAAAARDTLPEACHLHSTAFSSKRQEVVAKASIGMQEPASSRCIRSTPSVAYLLTTIRATEPLSAAYNRYITSIALTSHSGHNTGQLQAGDPISGQTRTGKPSCLWEQ